MALNPGVVVTVVLLVAGGPRLLVLDSRVVPSLVAGGPKLVVLLVLVLFVGLNPGVAVVQVEVFDVVVM